MDIKEGFCFLNRNEVNSVNRVTGAPGAREPDQKDHDLYNRILDFCADRDVSKFRTIDGSKIWKMD